jgi:hypothetical protein
MYGRLRAIYTIINNCTAVSDLITFDTGNQFDQTLFHMR